MSMCRRLPSIRCVFIIIPVEEKKRMKLRLFIRFCYFVTSMLIRPSSSQINGNHSCRVKEYKGVGEDALRQIYSSMKLT